MESQQHPSVELRLHWHERLIHWSGWERLAEYRRSVFIIAILALACVWLIGWWVAKRSTTSVASAIRAEAFVERLRSPGNAAEAPAMTIEEARKRLEALIPPYSALGVRFSGILAEEEVLERVQPITEARFATAVRNLREASLPTDVAVTEATKLTKEGKTEDALQALSKIIDEPSFPLARAYALVQKALLLHDQRSSNEEVVDEFQAFLRSNAAVREAVDQWVSNRNDQLLSVLRS